MQTSKIYDTPDVVAYTQLLKGNKAIFKALISCTMIDTSISGLYGYR